MPFRFLHPFLSLYGLGMYLYWLLRHYDQVGVLISLMDKDWRSLRILDVGSGEGAIAADPRMKGADITCVDGSARAVSACRKKGLRALRMDVRTVPQKLRKERFDIIWCLDVLEHLPKGEAFNLLSELERMAGRQVVVFLPLGYLPQDREPSGAYDSELVRHRSIWEKQDFLERGYRCRVLWGYHFDIRLYCSSLADCPHPVVRHAMWAVKERENDP
ncbi:MAG: hypothetical protein A2900_05995 [Candidatus Chisholmbacteria bacterium RIFCSPLOWO2_01_FULL_50_28]|uniref:Methyltransferase type 11 domain-containing protein n=1 Tax=Candidatus Chisholmbacteria bacterium RIFCSPHIGHO2_01_FULL_52_32 TaxID=1797591 RepID=A0A1G1VQL4_9BACT|nr:MAG: hypothetical protein A2786_05770 [Candidatus Chisholmbacteria bacterium RIFCSPHIGHO2_01_FULL_52_32]OGY20589.1 MAG: hypothetical protein A2900_05995 [Candidatus Chisholmbacteria bacterium RIFCSPLOWO2_01_FULL_50_28]